MMRLSISREEHPLLTISSHQNDRDYSENGKVKLIFASGKPDKTAPN
jgi:hypothetical protein